jgi:hypothetical protein
MNQDLQISTIEKLFRDCHRALRGRYRAGLGLGGFAALLAVLVVFVLLEQVLYLSPWAKAAFWVVAIGGGLAAAWTIRQRISVPPFTDFYRRTADEIGLPGIRHILDLSHSRYPSDSGFTEAAVRQNLKQIAPQDPEGRLRSYRDRHPASLLRKYTLLASAAGILLFAGVLLLAGEAVYRSGTFWVSYQRPIPFEFSVTPGDTTIEQGSSFQVAVRFDGDVPGQVRLGLRSEQEKEPRVQGMVRHDERTFLSRETELFEDAEFFVDMDGFRTATHRVRVELLPRLQEFTVTAHPPGYTGLDSQTFTYPFNRMEAAAGSELEIRARKNKPLRELYMIAESSGDTLAITPDSVITGRITALDDERFHFVMRDEFGLRNSNPFRFRLSVIADQAPFVDILSPESRIEGFVTGDLPLLYEFEDDYGFTAVQLKYRLHKAFVNVPVEGSVDLPVPARRRGLAEYDWDIRPMNLGAMDRLEYWIEVTDNNEIDGYQTTRSSTHIIEIPSLASRFFDQDEQEEQIESRFSEVEESYRRMQQDLERLREEIRTRPDEEWEHSQLIDEISEQRSDIEQQIDELRKDFEELTRDMEEQGMMSEDTMERYRELQQLMSEIDDPEILKLLEQMQENLSQMDQSQLREQLDQIQFNEERYRERLERTLELFKSLRLDADLDRMSKLLEDLAAQEEALSGQEQFGEEQVRQQEQIREQMQDLSDKLQQLPEKSPQRRMEQMQQMSEEMREQMEELDRGMQENIEQMEGGEADPDAIRQQQQDMSRQMSQMAQSLSDMRSQMQQQAISINIQALRYILDTLLLLSDEQEDVARRTAELPSNSPGFIDQARRQRNIAGQFGMITDSLYQVSAEIPQFSNRINDRKREVQRHMQRALDHLIERDRQQATSQERTALGGLNEIGTLVADLMDQLSDMQNGQGGEGGMSMEQMMEQLQNMSQDQQQLNQQIQDFINDIQGERLTQDHMERLEQMARQQNQIREQMRQLQRRGGREGDRLMSEIERLSEQMEDAINDLRGGSTDELMVERQQNILSRLLEVEESVHKRDEDEEERLGETAGEFERREVPELTMEELRQRIRSGADQTRHTRFREDYRRLIERYFELMEEFLEEPDARSQR